MSEQKITKRWVAGGLLAACCWVVARPADAQCVSSSINPWRRWEHTITTSVDYEANGGNPYREVRLKVEYTNAANAAEKYSTYAFWDGRNGSNQHMFKIRAAFGSGTWNWRMSSCQKLTAAGNLVSCNDNALQNACGTISVPSVIFGEQSPLYRDGFLKQPTNGMRHLVHNNGKEFFWLGDTAWNAGPSATATDWQSYVTTRGAVNQVRPPQFFSLVQIAPSPAYAVRPAGIPAPFTSITSGCSGGSGTIPDKCSKWDPVYWRQLDSKVEAANAAGMVVLIAGVMDPLDRGAVNKDGVVTSAYPLTEDAKTFARNLVARMYGNFVIFSPGFDDRTSHVVPRDLAIAVGNEIKAATSRHLITYHPGGEGDHGDEPPNPQNLHSQSWLSFDMVHSGHVANADTDQLLRALYRARVFPQRLAYDPAFSGSKILPVVNGEAAYDGGPTIASTDDIAHAYRVRQYGYVTLLSGAYAYTFGAENLRNWTSNWMAPLSWPSANQISHLKNIFRTVVWYRLVGSQTEHSRVENQLTDEPNRMVVAHDPNTSLVAYVPAASSTIELYLKDVIGYPASFTKVWYSPRTGASQQATCRLENGTTDTTCNTPQPAGTKRERYVFIKPACDGTCDANDWVLVLSKTATLSATSALSADQMRLWSAQDGEDGSHVVYALEGPGRGMGPATRASEGGRQSQSFPRVATISGGAYAVVWQSSGEGDEGEDVWIRRFSASGKPLADESRVNSTVEGDQTLPFVSSAASGDFVVVWSSRQPDGEGSDVFGRRFEASGRPAGGEFRVHAETSGEQSFPRVASAPNGEFVIAWESEGSDGSSDIYVRRFDAAGRQVGAEVRANAPFAGPQRLGDLVIQPSGESRVVWTRLASTGEILGSFERTFDRSGHPIGQEVALSNGL